MKSKIFLLFFLVSITTNVSAQEDSTKHQFYILSVYGNYAFASNAISNSFAKDYYTGAYIKESQKENVFDKLKDKNRFGVEFNSGINVQSFVDSIGKSTGWWLRAGLNHSSIISAGFSEDFFKLFFSGNKQFAGRTAQLSSFKLYQLNYQSIEMGLAKNIITEKGQHSFYAGINIFKGQNCEFIESDRATLFTEENGAYLDLDLQVKSYSSDSSGKSFGDWNGSGAGIDLYYSFENKNHHSFAVTINDLGMMQWNKKSNFISADKKFRFEGIDVSSLFDLSDTVTTFDFLTDSLKFDTYIDEREKKSFTRLSPVKINIEYNRVMSDHLQLSFIGRWSLLPQFNPQISLAPQYYFNHFFCWIIASYGGYEDFDAGIGGGYKWKSGKIYVSDNYLFQQIKKNGTAQGASLSLLKYF